MQKYKHITVMEIILDNHSKKLQELNALLDYLKDNQEDFNKLIDYYYSDQRQEDLANEEKGLIDKELKRGVLSEDAIYNLMTDYYGASIKMLELSTGYFKHQ
ncbi:DUF4298 domain-containing protein [Prevotella sp.]|uniref:DUF4298 domain-containing protein n=1 Tax=Prevotella sp. TaxID=59823 RepID=UPI002F91CB4B